MKFTVCLLVLVALFVNNHAFPGNPADTATGAVDGAEADKDGKKKPGGDSLDAMKGVGKKEEDVAKKGKDVTKKGEGMGKKEEKDVEKEGGDMMNKGKGMLGGLMGNDKKQDKKNSDGGEDKKPDSDKACDDDKDKGKGKGKDHKEGKGNPLGMMGKGTDMAKKLMKTGEGAEKKIMDEGESTVERMFDMW